MGSGGGTSAAAAVRHAPAYLIMVLEVFMMVMVQEMYSRNTSCCISPLVPRPETPCCNFCLTVSSMASWGCIHGLASTRIR